MLPAASHEIPPALDLAPPARSPLAAVGFGAAACFLLLIVDAMRRPPGPIDIEAMQAVQRIDLPYLNAFFERLDLLTDSAGAIAAWLLVSLVCLTMRWWLPLLGFLTLPLAGVINEGIGIFLVTRPRPHLEELTRQSLNWEERSFPSGHVVGAVLLYGFIWFLVGRANSRPLRWLARCLCGAVIFLTGFDRIWGGAHWPSDVLAAYALGTALLMALILAYRWAETALLAYPYPAPEANVPRSGAANQMHLLRLSARRLLMRSTPPSDAP